jgi:hypothetical protein
MTLPPETTNLLAAPVLTRLGADPLSLHSDSVPQIDQPVLPLGSGLYA